LEVDCVLMESRRDTDTCVESMRLFRYECTNIVGHFEACLGHDCTKEILVLCGLEERDQKIERAGILGLAPFKRSSCTSRLTTDLLAVTDNTQSNVVLSLEQQ